MWNYQYDEGNNMGVISTQYYQPQSSDIPIQYEEPRSLYHVADNFHYKNIPNLTALNYQQYNGAYITNYSSSPNAYNNSARQQSETFPNVLSTCYYVKEDSGDCGPSPKKLKLDSETPNEKHEVNCGENQLNTSKQETDDNLDTSFVFNNIVLSKKILDAVEITEQLKNIFAGPSKSLTESPDNSKLIQEDNNVSLAESSSSALLQEETELANESITTNEETETSEDLWYLNGKDENRKPYSNTGGGTCRNCRKIGHTTKFCKNPRKRPLCFICGSENHEGERCRNVICNRCLRTGHTPENCTWYDRENAICTVCMIPGHYSEECPDLWRRYHLTTMSKEIVSHPHPVPNSRVFCYNCAHEGHFGHECQRERIDDYSYPAYPFIIDYNIPSVLIGYSSNVQNLSWNQGERIQDHLFNNFQRL